MARILQTASRAAKNDKKAANLPLFYKISL